MKQIKVTRKAFPESDPTTRFTALVNGNPIMEFSIRDGKVWYRGYGSPLSNPFRPISILPINYNDRIVMNECRRFLAGFMEVQP